MTSFTIPVNPTSSVNLRTSLPITEMPVENIEMICQKMDNQTLAKFATSNKQINQICHRELRIRSLLEKLDGNWASCMTPARYLTIVRIDDLGDAIIVKEDMEVNQTVIEDMVPDKIGMEAQFFVKEISKQDLPQLQRLYNNLKQQNFKSIGRNQIWILKENQKFRIFGYERGRVKQLQNLTYNELLQTSLELNIKFSNDMSPENLRSQILKEVIKRDRLIDCDY